MVDDEEDDDGYCEEYDNDPGSLDREGCLFGAGCCMPGPHFESECHTAEMVEQVREVDERRRFEEWATARGLALDLKTDDEDGNPYAWGATALAYSAWRAALVAGAE